MPNGGGPIDLKTWLKQHREIGDEDFRFLVGHSFSSLRVPLTGVIGYLSMLADGDFKGEEQKIHKLLLEAVQKTIGSVNDIIALKVAYDRQLRGARHASGEKTLRKKVLHFESDDFLTSMYAVKFKQYELDYTTYANPSTDPVEIVLKEHPDLIIMSVIMPETDGFVATSLLKQDKRTMNIPVTFLTNLGQREDIEKGRALGAADYWITANHTPTDIVERARKILGLPKLKVISKPIGGIRPGQGNHVPSYQSLPSDHKINESTSENRKSEHSWIRRIFRK